MARIAHRGRSVRRRCFVADDNALIMPAFGAYAGGLNVRDPAFAAVRHVPFTAHMLGGDRVYAVNGGALSAGLGCRSPARGPQGLPVMPGL